MNRHLPSLPSPPVTPFALAALSLLSTSLGAGCAPDSIAAYDKAFVILDERSTADRARVLLLPPPLEPEELEEDPDACPTSGGARAVINDDIDVHLSGGRLVNDFNIVFGSRLECQGPAGETTEFPGYGDIEVEVEDGRDSISLAFQAPAPPVFDTPFVAGADREVRVHGLVPGRFWSVQVGNVAIRDVRVEGEDTLIVPIGEGLPRSGVIDLFIDADVEMFRCDGIAECNGVVMMSVRVPYEVTNRTD